MGTTNHGTQEITYEYFEEATAKDFNKRHLDIQPRGIYKGGYLVRVSDSEVTLSIFAAEIGDDDEQISVKTSTIAILNSSTLDSGSISSGTPFIVLRWGFLERADNYVEVHAIASVVAAQANDIIVGKCVFIGGTLQTTFDYTDRTFLTVQDLFFKVETSSGLYVQLRAGRIQDGTQYIIVPEQKVGLFSVPGSPNSRIDLVYIDTDGTVMIKQGSQAVSPTAPDYENKLVVAEVKIVNGDTSIPSNRITDVRSFLDAASGFTPAIYAGGESITFPNGFILKSGLNTNHLGNHPGGTLTGTVTFSEAFPNDCKIVIPSLRDNSRADTTITTNSISKAGFSYKIEEWNPTSQNMRGFDWFAVGH